jgi:hypothetical protein
MTMVVKLVNKTLKKASENHAIMQQKEEHFLWNLAYCIVCT